MEMTRDELYQIVRAGVWDALHDHRPSAYPFPNNKKLGVDGGQGYLFDENSIQGFVIDCYTNIRDNSALASVITKITDPSFSPANSNRWIGQTRAEFQQWITDDIWEKIQ